jgi:hypothetical protein
VLLNGSSEFWKELLSRHGFGAVIALMLLLALFGILPTPLMSRMMIHTERDQQRDALMFAVCLNLAGEYRDAQNRCWDALYGTGEIGTVIRRLQDQEKKTSR